MCIYTYKARPLVTNGQISFGKWRELRPLAIRLFKLETLTCFWSYSTGILVLRWKGIFKREQLNVRQAKQERRPVPVL